MANGDGAAVRIDARILGFDLQQLEAAENLRRERLVELDDVDILEGEAGALERLLRGGDWTEPHHPRLDPGDRGRNDARHWLGAGLLADGFRADVQRGGAVIDARGVAGGDDAAGKERLQLGETFIGSV